MYSTDKSIQILLALLKANNIKKVIASPGTSNASLVYSLQNDSWFEMYSSVDERSAAFIACGLAAESGEAVVLTCTGSTAARNYFPGLTEAYYRKLPILAITEHLGQDKIGHLISQCIDNRVIPNDVARLSVELPLIKNQRDEEYVVTEANRAILELFRDGGGPVHINMIATFSRDFSAKELPKIRAIERFQAWDKLPEMPAGKIAVYVGTHRTFSEEQVAAIDSFCGTHDALVICDHTSGYYGKYRLLPTLEHLQKTKNPIGVLDLMIHIGEVSAATFAGTFETKAIWRVSEDGELRNPFKKLTKIFQMSEKFFFEKYSKPGECKHDFIDNMKQLYSKIYANIPDLPFGNIWAAKQLSEKIPGNSVFHISVSNTRRSWNIFPLPEGVVSSCNVGCCGIDGCTSTLIGASLASPSKLHYLVTGDLAFFYDLNSIGNRHVGKNVRIMLVNNGLGCEFRINSCSALGEDVDKFVAARGHYGHQSPMLMKHMAEDLGYQYLSARTKEEFMEALPVFTNPEITEKPMIFELFVKPEDDKEAIKLMSTIEVDASNSIRDNIGKGMKAIFGDAGLKSVKKIFK